ncbi:MAG: type II secretion system protein [Patescibacteria group bacterium]|jgi:prepilin-type N-terminal cleavage/methylation domain-containing protein
MFLHKHSGFTLVELLVVIGVIAILAAIVLVAVNPGRQFANARDTQRQSDLYAITNAIYQYVAEHQGNLPDTDGDPLTDSFPEEAVCIGSAVGCFDLANAGDGGDTIVPTYIPEIPTDPSENQPGETGYFISRDENNRIIASASGELTDVITVRR